MKQTFLCSAVVVAMTGCFPHLPINKTNHQVPVVDEGGQLVAAKVVGNVGDDQATNAGIRVRSPSIDELRTWERVVELVALDDAKACFKWTDYQSRGDVFGDGQTMPPPSYANYKATTMTLDTASGKHYEAAAPTVDTTNLSFQYDSYVTEEYTPPHWVPAVGHWEKVVVGTCFDTTAPIAKEDSARWTIKGDGWELSFDFAFGGSGGSAAVKTAKRPPPPAPAPEPAPPRRPESFVGRWSGEVSATFFAGKDSDAGRTLLTVAIAEVNAGTVALTFEGGTLDCSFRAKVTDRVAKIAGGQVCKVGSGNDFMKFRTQPTELALSETGLTLSVQIKAVKTVGGKVAQKGLITLTGELTAI